MIAEGFCLSQVYDAGGNPLMGNVTIQDVT